MSYCGISQKTVNRNEFGFQKDGPKEILIGIEAGSFVIDSMQINDLDGNLLSYAKVEYVGTQRGKYSNIIGKETEYNNMDYYIVDLTEFNKIGTFRTKLYPNLQSAGTVIIKESNVYLDIETASLRMFYYQRASMEISTEFARIQDPYNMQTLENVIDFSRPLGHADTNVSIHASAATAARPAGSTISVSKGWYDNGFYSKNVVCSGTAVYPLLLSYLEDQEYYKNQYLRIPESFNDIPDILDEVKWELDWLISMQDPFDGGIYSKVTSQKDPFYVKPCDDSSERFVLMKTTAASLNVAAVCAKAYVAYKDYLPEYADTCLQVALKAYSWAEQNPSEYFVQPEGFFTKEYADDDMSDEFFWAGAELAIATEESKYIKSLETVASFEIPVWYKPAVFGLISIANSENILSEEEKSMWLIEMQDFVDAQIREGESSIYGAAIPHYEEGGGGNVAMQGLVYNQMYNLTGLDKYNRASYQAFDFLLGKCVDFTYCKIEGNRSYGLYDMKYLLSSNSASNFGYIENGPVNSYFTPNYYDSLAGKNGIELNTGFDDYSVVAKFSIMWNAPFAYLVAQINKNAYVQTDEPEVLSSLNNFAEMDYHAQQVTVLFSKGVNGEVQDSDFSLIVDDTVYSVSVLENNLESDANVILAFGDNMREYIHMVTLLYNGNGLSYHSVPIDSLMLPVDIGEYPGVKDVRYLKETSELAIIFRDKIEVLDISKMKIEGIDLPQEYHYNSDSTGILYSYELDGVVNYTLDIDSGAVFSPVTHRYCKAYTKSNYISISTYHADSKPLYNFFTVNSDTVTSLSITNNDVYYSEYPFLTFYLTGSTEIMPYDFVMNQNGFITFYFDTVLEVGDTLFVRNDRKVFNASGEFYASFDTSIVYFGFIGELDTVDILYDKTNRIKDISFVQTADNTQEIYFNVKESGYYELGAYLKNNYENVVRPDLIRKESCYLNTIADDNNSLSKLNFYDQFVDKGFVYDTVYLEKGIYKMSFNFDTYIYELGVVNVKHVEYIPEEIKGVEESKDYSLYPNVIYAKEPLHIQGIDEEGSYSIVSAHGAIVQEGELTDGIVKVENLNAGVYVIKVKTEQKIIEERFIVVE